MSEKKNTRPVSGTSRREFLGTAAGVVATASIGASAATSKVEAKSAAVSTGGVLGANDRINLGFIGCGMQFQGLLQRAFRRRKEEQNDFEYAALCDVWEPRLKFAQEQTKGLSTHRDYREIIARSDIDGVVIIVPDHWHFQTNLPFHKI